MCPRQVCKRVLARAAKAGFQVLAGLEYEWFNFRETPQSLAAKGYVDPEPISPGMFGYSLVRAGQNQPFFKALMEELPAFGVPIEGLHTETGPGRLRSGDPVLRRHRGRRPRRAVQDRGRRRSRQRFGIMPSFMAKWSTQYPGCSGHVHQSLSDGKTNLFYDARSPRRMSKLFESYLAGQLACLEDIQVFFAPTVNSYKRLVDGMWAPVKRTWGVDNRTASLRVIPGSPKSTRLETRCPGADINRLSRARRLRRAPGSAASRRGLKLKDAPLEGDAAQRREDPAPAAHARESHRESQTLQVRAATSSATSSSTTTSRTREWEWRQSLDAVTDWELKRYFEII